MTALGHVAHDESEFAPPAEVGEVELYHPKTFIGKYIWSQDAKVIAIQYAITAIGDRAGGDGVLVADAAAARRFRASVSFIDPSNYLQLVSMHGMIMVIYLLTALFLGGFGNYLIPLMVGARDMVFPVREHGQLLGVPAGGAAAGRELLRARRAERRRLDAVSAAGHPGRHAGIAPGHHPDARFAGRSSSSASPWAA